jgi:hypothetical protein
MRYLVLLLTLCSGLHAIDLSQIKFGMSKFALEKVLGEGTMRRDFHNPDLSHSLRYFAAREPDILPIAYFDRDLDLAVIVFRVLKQENGGRDPRTGVEWKLPRETGSRLLTAVAGRQEWSQIDGFWHSKNGKFFARTEDTRLIISRDLRLAKMISNGFD